MTRRLLVRSAGQMPGTPAGRLPFVAGQRTGEGWEYLRALRRLVLSLPPWNKWPAVSGIAIAFGGVVAVPVIGLITRHLLLSIVVSLALFLLLLGRVATMLERELHGDPGIGLKPGPLSRWMQLTIENLYHKTAEFTVTVEAIRPTPERGQPNWTVPWYDNTTPTGRIPPKSSHELILGEGRITRRDADGQDGELAGSLTFRAGPFRDHLTC